MKKRRFMALIIATLALLTITCSVYAHSGRTDANGGHKDNQNKSGLGSYHYHCGGHPAHLHTNGVCPYSSKPATKESSTSSSSKTTTKNTTNSKSGSKTTTKSTTSTKSSTNNTTKNTTSAPQNAIAPKQTDNSPKVENVKPEDVKSNVEENTKPEVPNNIMDKNTVNNVEEKINTTGNLENKIQNNISYKSSEKDGESVAAGIIGLGSLGGGAAYLIRRKKR